MVADSASFSPSAAKPAAVVESWKQLGIPIDIRAPTPVTVAQLKLAHEATMVDAILAGKEKNGFGNRLPAVASTLTYTSGAMLEAARDALRNGKVAIAPVSGFHHAGHAYCGGFCTFNGLIVTAQVLRTEGVIKRLGIVDFDQHYGDGTDDCIRNLGLDWISHFTAGQNYGFPDQADEFLAEIPYIVREMKDCALILYQAGADPHVDDPLGGWLTDEQLAKRDYEVFRTARDLNIPVAWNLAGGYQNPLRKVLDIHDQTLKACAHIYL